MNGDCVTSGFACRGSRQQLTGENDNFAALASVGWQVHVYGQPKPDTRAVCARRNLPLHVFSWRSEANAAGLQRNATYLVRPEGYVAFTGAAHDVAAFTSYLNTRKLFPQKQGKRSPRPTRNYPAGLGIFGPQGRPKYAGGIRGQRLLLLCHGLWQLLIPNSKATLGRVSFQTKCRASCGC